MSALGVIIGLHPISAGICLIVFFIFYMPTKYVSFVQFYIRISIHNVVNNLNHDASDLMIDLQFFLPHHEYFNNSSLGAIYVD